MIQTVFPIRTQPLHIVEDRLDKFRIFFRGIGVIHTEIELATVFDCSQIVHVNSFCMADMNISIGFRREPGNDFSAVLPGSDVRINDLMNKIGGLDLQFFFHKNDSP